MTNYTVNSENLKEVMDGIISSFYSQYIMDENSSEGLIVYKIPHKLIDVFIEARVMDSGDVKFDFYLKDSDQDNREPYHHEWDTTMGDSNIWDEVIDIFFQWNYFISQKIRDKMIK